jgi:hypothetical protein
MLGPNPKASEQKQLADQQMIDHRLIDKSFINFLAPFGPSIALFPGNVHMFFYFKKEFLGRDITRVRDSWRITKWRKKHREKSHVKIFKTSLNLL